MKYPSLISSSVKFAIKTHELEQKQKRKGKDVPYITHPLTVGLILSRAGCEEHIVAAGILHDTIEDSLPKNKVTRDMIAKNFGDDVAEIVDFVTEEDKQGWEERKKAALERIKSFTREALLVKSADVISNTTELIDDYSELGESVFARFHATKENFLNHQKKVIKALLKEWPKSPLAFELNEALRGVETMQNGALISPKKQLPLKKSVQLARELKQSLREKRMKIRSALG